MDLMTLASGLVLGVLVGGVGTYIVMSKKLQTKVSQWRDLLKNSQSELETSITDKDIQLQQLKSREQQRIKNYLNMISNVLDDSANSADITSEDLADINSKISLLTEMVNKITEMSNKAQATSKTGVEKINSVVEDLDQLTQSRDDLSTILEKFAEVQEKTVAIRFIGEEAEMLALNAAIEAARAGDSGRGFAVVADSMKSLAKNSQETTNEILTIVNQSDSIIQLIVNNFAERGEKLNVSIKGLVANFTEINTAIAVIQEEADIIDLDMHHTTERMHQVASNTTTALETLIKQLSELVSLITGNQIINISPQQASSRWHEFDEVIDVRREQEWNDELGHIDDIRFSTLQTDFKTDVKSLDPDKTYLFVCRSGGRSTKAAQMAIANGITKVFNLDGGMLEWRKQNL